MVPEALTVPFSFSLSNVLCIFIYQNYANTSVIRNKSEQVTTSLDSKTAHWPPRHLTRLPLKESLGEDALSYQVWKFNTMARR